MNRKFVMRSMIIGLTTIFLFALAGCGSSDENASANNVNKTSDSSDKVISDEFAGQELKVLIIGDHQEETSTDPKTGDDVPGLNELTKEFEARYPGATLNFVTTPWNGYQEKTQAMITSGDADVYQLPGIADYASQGLLEPLQPYIEKNNFDLDKYVSGQVDGWKSIGPDDDEPEIYGLPVIGDTRIMAYDKEIFDQWGVDYLSDHPTMDEILTKAKKMTGKNPKTGKKNYGVWYRGDYDTAFYAVNAAESLGGEWGTGYDWDDVKFEFSSDEMKQGVKWLKDLKQYAPKGIMSNQGDEKWLTDDNDIAMKLFVAPGDTIQDAQAAGKMDNVGISDDLSNDEGIGGMFAGSPYSIAKNSKHKDLAWAFLEFTASDFYQEFNWDELNIIPVTTSASQLKKIQDNPIAKRATEFLPDPWTPRYPWASSEPRNVLNSTIESVLTGKASVEDAMEKAQSKSERWLKRKK